MSFWVLPLTCMRVGVILSLVSCSLPCLATATETQTEAQLPPGTIDGKLTPELIPDIVAYRLFLSALDDRSTAAQDSSESVVITARRKSQLAAMQLSTADQTWVVKAAVEFNTAFEKATAVSLANNGSTDVNAKHPTEADLNDLAQHAIDSLRSNMTSEGFKAFQLYVQSKKVHMKIIPFPSVPQMSSH